MQNEIRILILEDLASDVVMMNHELRRAGLRFRTERVETREEFLSQLEHNRPDVILSDHGLPGFDGFTALAIAKDKCPDVPFIFVTSALGEELTIETFESGATDYVLKERLANLAPAVQRAVREAEGRRKHQEIEGALAESEERFRMLVDGVKDYDICMLDREGRITSWNAGAEWMKGYRAGEIIGQHFSRFYPPEDQKRDRPRKALEAAAAEGRFAEQCWQLRKSGARFRAHVVLTALRDRHGELRGFAEVARDITERESAEEALRRSEARKSAILDSALDAILSIDHSGVIKERNQSAQHIFGYPAAQALGRTMDQLIIPPELRSIYRDRLAEYLTTGVGGWLGRPIELALTRADQSDFQAELAITRVANEEPPQFTVVIRDISERKAAEQALRQSEERFRLLVEGVVDYAIYMLDAEGRVTFWNPGAERLMGFSEQDILGQPLARFYTAEDCQQHKPEQILQAAKAQGRVEEESWRMRKDGSRFWANTLTTALRDTSGDLRGFSRISRDVTERRQAQEEVRALNEQLSRRVAERTAELEAANNELEAFNYSVSHDLRAPLRHIEGFTRLLQKSAPELNAESRGYLETIADATNQMGKLINGLLAFSRIGRAELQTTRVSLEELVRVARQDLQGDAQGRRVDWVIHSLPEVQADPVLLRQVLVNFISNALKYTRPREDARIEIGARASDKEVTVFIRDNGVGFDMRYADKLFNVFQRLHPVAEFEGIGIGLANVRRIVQRHGGRVWAEGALGQGATFYFSLPVASR